MMIPPGREKPLDEPPERCRGQDRTDSLVVNVERGIMHSNSQLTDCFVSLALRRAAHDCITGDGSSGAALRLC